MSAPNAPSNITQEPIRPDGEAWEPIDFPRVTSLRLSFKNIIEAYMVGARSQKMRQRGEPLGFVGVQRLRLRDVANDYWDASRAGASIGTPEGIKALLHHALCVGSVAAHKNSIPQTKTAFLTQKHSYIYHNDI